MKILSITTSSPICGVAILENTSVIKEINLDNGLTHSETLMPIIKQILEETNLSLKNIDLLSCDIGPGSFTGIRIGVSTVKAFSDSLGIMAVGVTSLDALSLNASNSTNVVSLIDAKHDNVYNQIVENGIIKKAPSFNNIDELILELKNLNLANITFAGTGSSSYKNKILESFPNSNFAPINISAKNVGLAGLTDFKSR